MVRVWRQNHAPQIARRVMRLVVTAINVFFKPQSVRRMMNARWVPVLRVGPVIHGVRSVTQVVVSVIRVSKTRAWVRIRKAATSRVVVPIKSVRLMMMYVSRRNANAEVTAGYVAAIVWAERVLIAHVSAKIRRAVLRRVALRGMSVSKGQGALRRLVHATKRLAHGSVRAIVAEEYVCSCSHALA